MRILSLFLLLMLLTSCSNQSKMNEPIILEAPSAGTPSPSSTKTSVEEKLSIPPKTVKTMTAKRNQATKDPIVSQLFKASIAFVMPTTANIKDDIRAQLIINPNKDIDETAKQLTVKGKVTKHEIQISKVIIAKLTAPDFNVSAITPEEQAITTTEPTEWLWDLEPKYPGEHDVQLSIIAVVKVDGDKSEHNIKTFEKTVSVKITPQQVVKAWLEKYWQWLFSTLLLPLSIWVYKTKFKKKED